MTNNEKAPPRRTPDWERIEAQFRAGASSLREIAGQHGLTEGAIRKRAKRDGWDRDLSARVRAKADAEVRKQLVRTEVRAESVTEQQTVEVEAQVQARVRLAHRADIGRARNLAMALLTELEHQTDHQPLYDELADLLVAPDDEVGTVAKERARKLRDAYNRALSLAGRADTLKKLADALRVLIDKEREAFGITVDQPDGGQRTVNDALSALFANLHSTDAARIVPVRNPPANPLVKA